MAKYSTNLAQPQNPLTDFMLDNFTTKMKEVLIKVQDTSQLLINDSSAAPISIKLDGSNYVLWSQAVKMNISAKTKLGYINGYFPQPSEADSTFFKWCTENFVVKGWLINSMDQSLVANFIHFPTAK